jgi:hypothetical protein
MPAEAFLFVDVSMNPSNTSSLSVTQDYLADVRKAGEEKKAVDKKMRKIRFDHSKNAAENCTG